MRVWQCTNFDVTSVGGVEKHISEVSAALERLGHEVHIGPELPSAWQEPAPGTLIIHTHGDRWPNLIKARTQLWIHVCHGTTIGRVMACREFLSISGWRGSIRDFLPTHLATATVAVSQQALQEARRFFRMHLPAKVIPNGVDPNVFVPLRQITVEPRLIFVGRDGDRVKNVPGLLKACQAVFKNNPDFRLWAAPGIAHELAEHSFVKNLGPRMGADLAAALAQCRALILCSFYEGDPIVLHEAKAMGLPVIASDLPQLRQALVGYPNAIFVSPRNTESIAFGIRTAITGAPMQPSPQVREWKAVARDFDSFYSELALRSKK